MTVSNSWTDPSASGALDLTDGDTPTAAGYFDLLASDLLSLGGTKGLLPVCCGRLTLTSGTPVTTADVTGATNIYFAPYGGDRIALFSGTLWKTLTFTERTLALGTLTSGLPYDIFAYDSSGVVTLESLAWASGTARTTALTTQDGILVKSGATTRRYLGTFYTTSTTQTEDSASKRFLWNYYNRVNKNLVAIDTTDYWTYTIATYRPSNNNTTDGIGRFSCVVGWQDSFVKVERQAAVYWGSYSAIGVGIGVDSTSVNSAQIQGGRIGSDGSCSAFLNYALPVGYHYIQSLEAAYATGVCTWVGDYGLSYNQTGMVGDFLC